MKTAQASVVSAAAQSGRHGALAGITTIFLIATVCLSACTSIRPVADNAEALQQQIRTGQVLRKGDHVRVVTRDGVSRRLTVASVEDDVLEGRLDAEATASAPVGELHAETPKKRQGTLVEIPIREIVFVEEERVNAGKTAAAIGGGTIVLLSALLLIALVA
jgi:hypothetical protein